MTEAARQLPRVGRYQLGDELAAGGMATVHLARVVGPAGISRVVAVKRMHAHVASDPAARRMFLDEARLAYRISHPNVVGTLDVVEHDTEVLIVLQYVAGETLAKLLQALSSAGQKLELSCLSATIVDALHGLHAAHEARDELGHPVEVVHRDVSPQNLLVGADGVTRVLDFGIAKAKGRLQETTGVAVRGKLRYLSPEQIRRAPIDRRADLFATGVVLWEALVGRRLFDADDIAGVLDAVLHGEIPAPHQLSPDVPEALSQLVLRTLSRDPGARPATAIELAEALSAIVPPASASTVAAVLRRHLAAELQRREGLVARLLAPAADSTLARPPVRVAATDPDATEPEVAAPAAARAPDTTPPARPQRRSIAVAAGVLVSLLILAALAVAVLSTHRNPSPPRRHVSQQPSAHAEATTIATSGALPLPPLAASAPAPEPVVSASRDETSAARRRAGPSTQPARPASSSAKPASTKLDSRTADCEFPFVIGQGGVKIPKKACFGR